MTAQPTRPWWLEVVFKLGVPAALSIFLVWWLTSVVAASLVSIQSDLSDHVASTNIYLRGVCLHTAKNDAERAECPPLDLRKEKR